MSNKTRNGFWLVGIGASAGGLEALREFIESLPDSSDICYVVAKHVSPTHESLLMNLLASSTQLAVKNLEDNQDPEPLTIYITPPNRDVIVKQGRLCLTEPHFSIRPKPSINHLFASMADAYESRAVGIVLSGTGSDGAAGLQAIKAAGGVTLVQEPGSAEYDSMPKAAIRTGSVDLVQTPGSMGATLDRMINQKDYLKVIVSESDQQTDAFAQVLSLVRQQTSFQLEDYNAATIRRRIARRMGIVGVSVLSDYMAYLAQHDNEAQLLVKDTFIGGTSFFRDEKAFAALKKNVEKIVVRKEPGEVIRCWVPGCASGEEAYSLAFLFERTIARNNRRDLRYRIFASDLDPDALEHARQAIYPLSHMEDIPQSLQNRYTEEFNGYCRILKHIRNRLVFTRHNVIEDPPFSRLDLVSCRNLLIYFNQDIQKQVLEIFHYALNPDGVLFLGKAETPQTDKKLFKAQDKQNHIYGCLDKVSHYLLPVNMGISHMPRENKDRIYKKKASTDFVSMCTLEVLTARYAPPSLVINDADSIIHFQGNLKPFLDFSKGAARMCLFDMLSEEIKTQIRALVYRCRRKPATMESRSWQLSIDGAVRTVKSIVSPLESGDGSSLLISFQALEENESKEQAVSLGGSVKDNLIVSELEQELSNTRSHLHAVVEELEIANEKLQTANEELQSTNEELLTVNGELQVKTDELERTVSDLLNVKERFDMAAQGGNEGLWDWDLVSDEIFWSPRFNEIIGYGTGELETTLNAFSRCIHPDDRERIMAAMHTCRSDGTAYNVECHIRKKSGEYIWVAAMGHAIEGANGLPSRMSGCIIDISQKKQSENELRLAASVFGNTQDGIMIMTGDRTILKVNSAFEQILGYKSKEIVGKNSRFLQSGHHDQAFYDKIWNTIDAAGSWQGEVWERHKNGWVIPVWFSINSLCNGRGDIERYIAILYDLTDQKKAQERINYLAHYDILTGLPNRAMFKDRLCHALKLADRQKTMLALLCIDLDNFKQVNDTYGHPAGDELLCRVAKKLQNTLRISDTLSRPGGDEFIILLEQIKDPVSVKTTAEKVVRVLAEPVDVGETEIFLSASVGISLFPDDGPDIDTLVRNADMAMYRSKDEGRNQFHFYKEEMSKTVQERSLLQNDLRRYMEKHGLELYYQPVVDSRTRQCMGIEALVRWNHDEKGFIPPEKFIPIAEDNDLIHTLGEWVLFTACRQMKTWIDQGVNLEFISVNVSGKQILQGDFVQTAKRILELTGCPVDRVTLELTENFIMGENRDAVEQLKTLREMGFGLAIDDFGTGYSSLSHLKDLPVTTLKVDRSFVRDIHAGNNEGAIAGAIIKLGDRLGLKVIAEGVENEDQHQFLQSQQGILCQGFLYARPMSSVDFFGFSQPKEL